MKVPINTKKKMKRFMVLAQSDNPYMTGTLCTWFQDAASTPNSSWSVLIYASPKFPIQNKCSLPNFFKSDNYMQNCKYKIALTYGKKQPVAYMMALFKKDLLDMHCFQVSVSYQLLSVTYIHSPA
jgi:hypothetical protein